MLWTFADLNDERCSLRSICNTQLIRREIAKEWLEHEVWARKLTQLLNTTLRKSLAARGLVFDSNHGRYYFPPDNGSARRVRYKSLQKTLNKPVVYPYPKVGPTQYWVHWAAKFRFLFFGLRCYLAVEPCMVFSRDGVLLIAGEEVGRLSTFRTSHQYNRNVLGFLFFWKSFLRGDSSHIVVFPARAPQTLVLSRDYLDGEASFGIEGDLAEVKAVAEDLDEIDLSASPDDEDEVDLSDPDGGDWEAEDD
jgi:hypothetical protein